MRRLNGTKRDPERRQERRKLSVTKGVREGRIWEWIRGTKW
jgi:hypothetical protein